MANCKPEAYNGCTSAGTGPNCNNDPGPTNLDLSGDYSPDAFPRGEEAKKRCLEQHEQDLKDLDENLSEQCQNQLDACHNGCPPPESNRPVMQLRCSLSCQGAYYICMGNAAFQLDGEVNTANCYCKQLKCPGPNLNPGGFGGTNPKPAGDPITVRDVLKDARGVDLAVTNSQYGIPIELVYGKTYLPGNVVWLSEPRETQSKNTVVSYEGKTLVRTTYYTIATYIDLHLALCAGMIDGVSRIWLDSVLIYDKTTTTVEIPPGVSISFYKGSPAQKVVADVAHVEGFGRVPAYRDMAGMYVTNIDLNTLNGFPQWKVEVARSVSDDQPALESEEYADYQLFKVDVASRRVFITDGANIKALDYDSLTEVIDVALSGVVALSELPLAVTSDGTDIGVHDFNSGTLLTTVEDARNDFAVVYMLDDYNYQASYLVSMGATCKVYLLNELTAALEEIQTISESGEFATFGAYIGSDEDVSEVVNSLFLSKLDGTNLIINEYMVSGTNPLETRWAPSETIIPVGGATAILSVVSCISPSSLIIFLDDRIIGWSPASGVTWTTSFGNLPGSVDVRAGAFSSIVFVGTDAVIYSLDVATGVIHSLENATHAPKSTTAQFYDFKANSITYVSTADVVVRAYASRVEANEEALGDIVADLAKRSGLRLDEINAVGLSGTPVVGYRSGSYLKGADIITDLETAFQFRSYVDNRIEFLMSQTASTINVNINDLEKPFSFEKSSEENLAKTVTINYISVSLDGEPWSQSFQLPDEVVNQPTLSTFTFTLTADDTSMAQLAEFLAIKGLEDAEASARIRIPSKYLAATPTDLTTVNGGMRIKQIDIGADFSLEVQMNVDSVGKYSEQAALSGIEGDNVDDFDREVPSDSPFPLSVHVMQPDFNVFTSTVLSGLTDVVHEFDTTDTIGVVAGGTTLFAESLPGSVLWGRLLTIPPFTIAAFTTQNVSIDVLFCRDVAGYFSNATLEELYADHHRNLILVDREWLQFQNASVAMDGKTVTFSGLFRARYGSDHAMHHAAGEIVLPYQPTLVSQRVISKEYHADNREPSFKMGGTGTNNTSKRFDVQLDPYPLLGQGAHNVHRWDTFGDVRLLLGTRLPFYSFTDTLDEETVARNDSIEAYFLNAPYDETLFDSLWDDPYEGTYIIGSVNASAALDNNNEAVWAINYDALLQDEFGFDKDTMDINVVLINGIIDVNNDPFLDRKGVRVTRRVVMRWSPGDYSVPRRGQRLW